MMSAPLPDWMAAVMRGWRSLALMNSSCTSAPSAFEASGACRLSSTSASGMKSTQRTMCSLVPWANAGARRAPRMPSSPAPAAMTATEPVRNRRRVTRDATTWTSFPGVFIDSPRRASRRLRLLRVRAPAWPVPPPPRGGLRPSCLRLVDLLQLAVGPLHGVLRLHPLHALGVHVRDDVLCEALRRLGGGGTGVAEQPGVTGSRAEHLERLVEVPPHRVVLPHLRGADAVAFLGGEPLAVVVLLVDPAQKVLGQLWILRVLHEGVGLVQEEEIGARRSRGKRGVPDVRVHGLALVVLDLILLALGHDVDAGPVQGG